MVFFQSVAPMAMVLIPIAAALAALFLQFRRGPEATGAVFRLAMGASLAGAVVVAFAGISLFLGAWPHGGGGAPGALTGAGGVGPVLFRFDRINVFPVLFLAGYAPLVLLTLRQSIISLKLHRLPIHVLLMEGLFLGAFLATRLGVFFFFMESTVFLLILVAGMWGSKRRVGTAWKIAIFHLMGSMLLAGAVLFIGVAGSGAGGEGMGLLGSQAAPHKDTVFIQSVLFGVFFFWSAIRMGLPPFHSWLADLFAECPPALGLVVAIGGGHGAALGLVRFAIPLLPLGVVALLPVLVWVVVGCLLYGALVVVVQRDFRRPMGLWSSAFMVAFLLGVLTVTREGTAIALFALVVNGLVLGGLAFSAESLLARRQRSNIRDYGGLARQMPVLAVVQLVFVASATLVPGFAGFVTTFGLASSIRSSRAMDLVPGVRWLAAAVLLGAMIWAVTMFWGYGRMMFGPLKNPLNWGLKDLNGREKICHIPLAVLLVLLGVFPQLVFNVVQPPAVHQAVQGAGSLSGGEAVGVGVVGVAGVAHAPDGAPVGDESLGVLAGEGSPGTGTLATGHGGSGHGQSGSASGRHHVN